MIEKILRIEDVPLVELLGVENMHIKEISSAFPSIKITSRGDEIKLNGKEADVERVYLTLESMIEHYLKYGEINKEIVQDYLTPFSGNNGNMSLDDFIIHGPKGVVIKPKSANQAKIVEAIESNDLVFAIGPAGTGKTFVSVALAVRALKNKWVKRVVVTRPAVEAGENLGFLPGDLKEKIDPYIRPIYDSLADMLEPEKLKQYQEANTIEIAPLAYMRGRTLSNAFILLDEAQNTTPMQLKMFLTRLGQGSKAIITGDMTQIDLPRKQKSGLIHATEILKNVKGIAFVYLDGRDVSRHPLVKEIIKAYDKSSQDSMFDSNS
ncbi:MAG: PhoH family protein [Bacteroidota bacterium]|nr:PhoH family protein [Bacteroidota bacterium]